MDNEACGVCGGKLSPKGNCHRCNEIKALVRDPGWHAMFVVLGDGKPLPRPDDEAKS